MIEVLAKGLGSKVDEAAIKKWFIEEGDPVNEGDDLVELVTEDSVVVISAPASGILTEVYFDEDETVQRDEVICIIDDEAPEMEDEEADDDEDEK
ncbi:MAG TPA: biotin/lipoyl-binding protein [Candidatus Omnitrophota bacterium]|nr:biotin/lipoyl-binding protein [Candidatus Omnitrophota bacterium]